MEEDIPIIVVTKGDLNRMHTLFLLENYRIPAIVVVHDDRTKQRVKHHFPAANIVVSGTHDLVEKRNWILNNLVRKNRWFIGMDDNIREFTAVAKSLRSFADLPVTEAAPARYGTWRAAYNRPINARIWLALFKHDIMLADEAGFPLVGVATMENPFFRAKRYSYYRFVKTKVFAMRNVDRLYFKHLMCHDSWLTAQAIARHGGVLVDSYLHHRSKMYEQGGLGNRKEREAQGLLDQLDDIVATFDGLVMRGRGANTALRLRLTNQKSVEHWRKKEGYIR